MLPYERQSRLFELFQSGEVISAEDIVQQFNVSIATARRDLKHLEDQQQIKKVYGGAVLIKEEDQDAPLKERMCKHQAEKDAIGRACAEMVQDGDFIILDCGTTALYAARYMKYKKNLTVVTNSVLVLNELTNSNVSVVILGGQLRKEELSLVGPSAVAGLDGFQAVKCFISASGLSLSYGVSDFVQDEIEVKKKSITRSSQVIVLADSFKFNYTAPRYLCALEDVHTFVTDASLDPDTEAAFRAAGCNLILAK